MIFINLSNRFENYHFSHGKFFPYKESHTLGLKLVKSMSNYLRSFTKGSILEPSPEHNSKKHRQNENTQSTVVASSLGHVHASYSEVGDKNIHLETFRRIK